MALSPLNTKRERNERLIATLLGTIGVAAALWCLTTLGQIVDTAVSSGVPSAAQITCAVVAAIIAAIFTGARVTYSSRSAIHSEIRVRQNLARTSLNQPTQADATGEDQAGAVINMMTDGAERLMLYRQTFIPQIFATAAIPLLTISWIMIGFDWLTGLVLALCLPLIPLLVRGFMLVMRKVSGKSRRARANLAAAYLDAIEGIDTLQMLAASRRVGKDLARRGEENRQAIMRLLAGNQLVLFVIDISFSLFMVAATAIMVFIRMGDSTLSVGQGTALVLMSVLLLEPIDQVGAFFYVGMGGMAAQRAAKRYLDSHPAPHVVNSQDELTTGSGADAPALSALNIEAGYQRDENILKGVSIQANHGERLAIVGPSGQGKSTLLRVLSGQLQPHHGNVLLEGHEATAQQLRDASAVVAQSTWLFAGTVAHNLRLVKPQATDEELWEVLALARVDEEIKALPRGLETKIGERGYGLSGGQAQRLAIARALLSERKLLLLDEPTSAVDIDSEERIRQSLSNLNDQYTVVMVTHREGLLPGANQTIHIEQGCVAASAKHEGDK
ncbi:ABC transporter ATP-binding protein/permease [Actinomycetaceae bacterium TAE3-ERU4]|nr:ABC transporter ATP-binding protein/permease [Actinomycetaceae bacterium TAE3-ERU4]